MAERIRRRWCPDCERPVKAIHFGTTTGTHIAASCITFGMWVPVWVLMEVFAIWRCDRCGMSTSRRTPRHARPAALGDGTIDVTPRRARLSPGDREKAKRDRAREKYLAERETWKGRDGR